MPKSRNEKEELNLVTGEIEAYIKKVEKKEKKKQQKGLLFLLLVLVTSAGIGVWGFQASQSSSKYAQFELDDLSLELVEAEFSEGAEAIIVTDTVLQLVDTISSISEYLEFAEIYLPLEPISFEEETEGYQDSTMETDMHPISQQVEESSTDYSVEAPTLIISGTRAAQSSITFKVDNYHPDNQYYVDLGNGIKKKIGRRLSYQYPKPGIFRVELLTVDKNGNELKSFQEVKIKRSVPKEDGKEIRKIRPKDKKRMADKSEEEKDEANWKEQELLVASRNQGPHPEDDAAAMRVNTTDENANRAEANKEKLIIKPRKANPYHEMEVLNFADQMPQFPGGSQSMISYFQNNMTYPRKARVNKVGGKVYLRLIVEPNGSVSNIKVARGIGHGCDEEAIRLAKNMPAWKPGVHKGKNVRVEYTLAVKFNVPKSAE